MEGESKMKELIILIGPPGSGKSTHAYKGEKNGCVRISQDDMGKDGHRQAFRETLLTGKNIILDRMNFNKQQRRDYIILAKQHEYRITAQTFFVSHDTCFERMSLREDHPTIKGPGNALNALHTFYSKFEYPTLEEGFDELKEFREQPKAGSKPCVIVDIDGTVANLDHRLHYVRGEKKDWRTFLSKCDKDTPNHDIYLIAESFCDTTGSDLVFCSGRGNEYRDKTEMWLKEYNMQYEQLFMRQERDYRQDTIVKEQILDFEILTRYREVLAVFDDRSSVVKVWRNRGLRCLQVAAGDF
jgi:hypothetical protein